MLSQQPASTRFAFSFLLTFLIVMMVVGPSPRPVGAQSNQFILSGSFGPSEPLQPRLGFGTPGSLINWNRTMDKGPNFIDASSCFAGSTLAGAPTFGRVITQTAGSGLGSPCSLSGSGTAVRYKVYQFNLTGCQAFPSQVTVTICPIAGTGGVAPCDAPAGNLDTVVYIYRSGGLTDAGGTIAPFDPANPCNNAVAANDDLAVGTATNPGGSSCDGAGTCHPVCTGNTSTSGLLRSLGSGYFNIVVAGFGNATSGSYNLFVNAPGSGCQLANTPTAATGTVAGRLTDASGSPIAGAVVTLSGTQERKLITDADGNYRFEEVETSGFYTVRPVRANFDFSPAERSFSQLSNQTEAAFTGTPTAGFVDPLDTPEYFVRQHYLDFLGREPDEAGFNFWSDQILACGGDTGCIETKRINVSAAYFLSIEFQRTGGLVDGLYRASFGRAPKYAEFMPDTAVIARDIVVGRGDWEGQLAANKREFVDAFVDRAAFRAAFDGLSDTAYVDKLIEHSAVSIGERDALVSSLQNGATRADVLLRITEHEVFVAAKRNAAFVMMEYFGYLRRDPDESGYQFWLNKLNQFDGNFERAEMVKAFISSGEYRARFQW